MPSREAERSAPTDRPVARGIWSGSISFGLVTVPVELYSANRRGGVSLRMLGPGGAPLARKFFCPKDDKELSSDDIERGYEIAEGEFVTVTDEELEQLAPRRSRDIELTRFVDRAAIDPAYFVRAYFLVPAAEQTKAYRLLADTMQRTGRAALASFVMRGKAYAVAIFADGGILRAETLRFGDELRRPSDIGLPAESEPEEARVRRMRKAIASLAAEQLDPSELADEEPQALVARARAKQKRGEDVVEAPEVEKGGAVGEDGEEGGEVVDLVALIKQRMGAPSAARREPRAEREPGPRAGPRKAGVRRAAGGSAKGDLAGLTKDELQDKAKKLGIEGRSKMTRAELEKSIRRAG